MAPYEYLLPLVSVLVGLALADLLTSVHRLLRARQRVRWDWLPLAAALLAAVAVLDLWWGVYGLLHLSTITFARFAPQFLSLVLLFLLASAALPDRVPGEDLDLRRWYAENAPYFWALYAGYIGSVVAFRAVWFPFGRLGVPAFLLEISQNLLVVGLIVWLALSRRRLLHAVALPLLLLLLLAEQFTRQLGSP